MEHNDIFIRGMDPAVVESGRNTSNVSIILEPAPEEISLDTTFTENIRGHATWYKAGEWGDNPGMESPQAICLHLPFVLISDGCVTGQGREISDGHFPRYSNPQKGMFFAF